MQLLNRIRPFALALAFVAAIAGIAVAPQPAEAGLSMLTATRTDRCNALVTTAGSGAILRLYDGTRPANAGTALSGNTLRATLTITGAFGTCSSGVLTLNTTVTQTNSSHVTGTTTFIRIFKADGTTVVLDIDICGSAPCWTLSGTVTNGQNVTFPSAPTLTEGNA